MAQNEIRDLKNKVAYLEAFVEKHFQSHSQKQLLINYPLPAHDSYFSYQPTMQHIPPQYSENNPYNIPPGYTNPPPFDYRMYPSPNQNHSYQTAIPPNYYQLSQRPSFSNLHQKQQPQVLQNGMPLAHNLHQPLQSYQSMTPMINNHNELFQDQNDPAYVNNQPLLTPQLNKWGIKSSSQVPLQGNNSESSLNYNQSQQPQSIPNSI